MLGGIVAGVIYKKGALSMDRVTEFVIYDGLAYYEPGGLSKLKGIWAELLCKDPRWHFFFEGDYTLIRCDGGFADRLEKKLRNLGLKFERTGEWVDNIAITRKYQELFEAIFHGNSEFAMRAEDREISVFLDRITHCFLNNCRTIGRIEKWKVALGVAQPALYWESMLLSQAATGRALVIGELASRSCSSE